MFENVKQKHRNITASTKIREEYCVLGCDAVYSGKSLSTSQGKVSLLFRDLRYAKKVAWVLKMEAV
jgi:hypothetical protein